MGYWTYLFYFEGGLLAGSVDDLEAIDLVAFLS